MTHTHHPLAILLLLLLLASLLLTSCGGIFYAPPTATEYCGIDPALLEVEAGEKAEAEGKTVIELWATAERQYCWRAYAPLLAATQRPDLSLAVNVSNLEINERPLSEQLMELAARGEAPDGAYLFQHHAVPLGEAGFLHPVDECRHKPEFDRIPEPFWRGSAASDDFWGVPIDFEVTPLFYNKTLLAKLGWTQAQIDALPADIFHGKFLLDDLIATARAAIDAGVVDEGMAFLPQRGQVGTTLGHYAHLGGPFVDPTDNLLVIERDALAQTYSFLADLNKHQLFDPKLALRSSSEWGNKLSLRDAAVHDRILFWHTAISEFPRLAMDYMDSSNNGHEPNNINLLGEQIGVALMPSVSPERSAYARINTVGVYVIFAPHASGRTNQEAVCNLLATTHSLDLFLPFTEQSGHITFADDGFHLPNNYLPQLSLEHLVWNVPTFEQRAEYRNALSDAGTLVQNSELTPNEAVDVAVEQLRETFGNRLIVE